MGKNCLTAVDARNLADEATSLINSVFKVIKSAAERGEIKTVYSSCNLSIASKELVVSKLKELGYAVNKTERVLDDEFSTKEIIFEIYW